MSGLLSISEPTSKNVALTLYLRNISSTCGVILFVGPSSNVRYAVFTPSLLRTDFNRSASGAAVGVTSGAASASVGTAVGVVRSAAVCTVGEGVSVTSTDACFAECDFTIKAMTTAMTATIIIARIIFRFFFDFCLVSRRVLREY